MAPRLIGQILKEVAGISEEVIQEALSVQREKGGRIGEILIQKKAITESDLLKALAIQVGIHFWDKIPFEEMDLSFAEKVPIHFLRRFKIVPVLLKEGSFLVMNDPAMLQPADDLKNLLNLDGVEYVLCTQAAILSTINYVYDTLETSAEEVIQGIAEEEGETLLTAIEETGDLLDDTSDAPIIKFVNLLLSQATKAKASDIHIEPYQNRLKVRYRIDGVLYDMHTPPKHVQARLVSRIKIMAKMNIAEKRLPQDGRMEIKIGDRHIDVRVSTVPTAFGERVVMRLLDKAAVLLRLTELGMDPGLLVVFDRLIRSAHGIILVTGPTGSGKTTTLYAALSTINRPDINIITLEDPIEYQMDGVSQIQVNPKINLTFANGLRSIVRQDPDVILVGEIRDLETAEIAIQAALTGHLVFSTLHTNDSASSVTRLIDMGIEPFLVSSSVLAILAQRLVRTVCQVCKEPYMPDPSYLGQLGITPEEAMGATIYRAVGCNECLNTGYKGRTGIFELLVLNDEIRATILKTSDSNAIKKVAMKHGLITLSEDGAKKVLAGITTIEEVLRVTQAL